MPELSMKIGEEPAPLTEPKGIVATPTTEGGVTVKKEETPATVPAKEGERPAWLPEKFKTAEEFAKSYGELEKKLGEKPAPVAPTLPAGIDLNAISKEFAENEGKLTDATLKSLADKGVTKEQVDGYIAGQQAIGREQRNSLAEAVGGDKNLNAILSWAKTGLSAAERSAYNSMIDSNNTEGAKLLLGSIAQKYSAANGIDPTLVKGVAAANQSGVKPFESSAQVVEAMKDKRYQTDSAYRRTVEQRLAVSTVFTTTNN